METPSIAEYVTTESPTRLEAFDRPGVWVEQTDTAPAERRGGFCYATFHEPTANVVFPAISNGIYLEICQYQGDRKRGYLLDGYVERPDWHRDHRRFVERYATFAEAKTAGFAFIAEARAFVATAERDPRLCDCCGVPVRREEPARCASCGRDGTFKCDGCRARRALKHAAAATTDGAP